MKRARVGKNGLIFIILGPSGSGKTTLRDKLLQDSSLALRLVKSVSLTTRKRRTGERHGRDYFFVSEAEFGKLKRSGKVLEWTRYLGYYYGTSRDFLKKQLARGKNILLCVDGRGARAIKKLYPRKSIAIFVMPPSLAALKQRIAGRCRKTTGREIKERLALARKELASAKRYDYRLVNKDLRRSVAQLRGIIIKHI